MLVSGIARNTVLRQAVRHEWVSWYILQEPQLKKWIISHFDDATKEIDWQILLWSITRHHPAFRREIPSGSPNGSSDKMDLLLAHSDGLRTTVNGQATRRNSMPIQLASRSISAETDVYERIRRSLADAKTLWHDWKGDQETVGILAAVKNTLVAADVAGSALPTSSIGNASHAEWRQLVRDSGG